MEATFLAVSDEHRETRRGRTFDFHTDRLRVVTLGDLADEKIEWVVKGPHQRYVKDEVPRLAGGDEPGDPNVAPAGQGDEGILTKFSQLEKEIGDGPAGRKRKPEGKEPATAKTPKGKTPTKRRKRRQRGS